MASTRLGGFIFGFFEGPRRLITFRSTIKTRKSLNDKKFQKRPQFLRIRPGIIFQRILGERFNENQSHGKDRFKISSLKFYYLEAR